MSVSMRDPNERQVSLSIDSKLCLAGVDRMMRLFDSCDQSEHRISSNTRACRIIISSPLMVRVAGHLSIPGYQSMPAYIFNAPERVRSLELVHSSSISRPLFIRGILRPASVNLITMRARSFNPSQGLLHFLSLTARS